MGRKSDDLAHQGGADLQVTLERGGGQTPYFGGESAKRASCALDPSQKGHASMGS